MTAVEPPPETNRRQGRLFAARKIAPSFYRRAALDPFLAHLTRYDQARTGLERHGGSLDTLKELTAHLRRPLRIRSGKALITCLGDHRSLRSVLRQVDPDLHLEVRQGTYRMPLYYLCRLRGDYWCEYSLVVEELYVSPGYPLPDSRLVSLMWLGHETPFLRLAPLRSKAVALADDGDGPPGSGVDELLYQAGRQVLQSAWHQDQHVAVEVSQVVGLPRFLEALELVYLCLGAELCELRAAASSRLAAFFRQVYPRPAIARLLSRLPQTSGDELILLPRQAALEYRRLLSGFRRLISTEVARAGSAARVPFWKLAYANLGRLKLLEPEVVASPELRSAAGELEQIAQRVIGQLTQPQASLPPQGEETAWL